MEKVMVIVPATVKVIASLMEPGPVQGSVSKVRPALEIAIVLVVAPAWGMERLSRISLPAVRRW